MSVELGDEVIDIVSGFKGIASACHNYLNGCNRISVQPPVDNDGRLPEAQSFDEPQLKVLTAGKVQNFAKTKATPTGGPEKFSDTPKTTGRNR